MKRRMPWYCVWAFAVASVVVLRPAAAQIASISQQQETAPGTYYLPVDASGNYAPGYFYVAANTTVTFTIDSSDGSSLHIFTDAAGTTEITVPASLQMAGVAQTPDALPQIGDVFVTAGWHKLYVAHSILTQRTDPSDCMCRLWYSAGQLYQKMESVQPDYCANEWQGDAGTYTSAVTLRMVLPDGSPAVGDSMTWAIAQVTSDPAGLNPITLSGIALTGDATTGADGVANGAITWTPPSGFTGPAYLWLATTDNSRQSLVGTPTPDGGTGGPFALTRSETSAQAVVPITNPVVVAPSTNSDRGPRHGGIGRYARLRPHPRWSWPAGGTR